MGLDWPWNSYKNARESCQKQRDEVQVGRSSASFLDNKQKVRLYWDEPRRRRKPKAEVSSFTGRGDDASDTGGGGEAKEGRLE